MKTILFKRTNLLLMLAVLVAGLLFAQVARAATVEICTNTGGYDVNVNNKLYFVMNNVWGASTAQCISVNDATGDFTITRSDHSNGNQVAAYPAIVKGCQYGNCTNGSGMPTKLSTVTSATSTWSITRPSSGVWNAAYDIWLSPVVGSGDGYKNGAEIMIWIDSNGGAGPGGSQVATVTIGGAQWEVWYADWDWNYIAYKRVGAASSVNLNLKDFFNDAVARGYVNNAWYLHAVEAGFELWQGGAGLASKGFTASVSGTPAPTATPVDWTKYLKVQYSTGSSAASTGSIAPTFNVVDSGPDGVAMDDLTLRYWYTIDGDAPQQMVCNYSVVNCANITTKFVKLSTPVTGADYYMEMGFTAWRIWPGGSSGEMQMRFNKADWSNYTQTNDYSFDGTKTSAADWNKVTLYYKGKLVWGTEPSGAIIPTTGPSSTSTLTPVVTNITLTPTRTSTPVISLTPTRTVTVGVSPTPTRTSTAGITLTPTRTNTTGPTPTRTLTPAVTLTPTPTLTSGTPVTCGGCCGGVTGTITAPFTQDGAGTFCWQSTNLGAYINSWNTTSVTINGVNVTNIYVAAGSYPAKINGYWYVSYNSTVSYGHFEAK